MKIIYLSSTHSGMHDHSIYFDLMQEFVENGHEVTIAYAREKRLNLETDYYEKNNIKYLGIKTGNFTKNTNLIDKGISLLSLDGIFTRAIKKHLKNNVYDLVLYSTPPITFINTLKYIKKTSPNVYIYLMLKDIFPQNAVDIDMMGENGLIHKFFRRKEKKLYSIVDFVGTMSPANQEYFIKNNPEFKDKVEVLPNAIKLRSKELMFSKKDLGLDEDKIIIVYGGNLGFPQAIDYLVECAKSIEDIPNLQFVVAGTGSRQDLVENYINEYNPKNFTYLGQLEKSKYDELVYQSDIGLIFLDHRFTIPNYPQRLLSYLEAKIPVIVAADNATDMGVIAEDNNYGIKVYSQDVEGFKDAVEKLVNDKKLRDEMGENGYEFLKKNYTVEEAYKTIERRIKWRKF